MVPVAAAVARTRPAASPRRAGRSLRAPVVPLDRVLPPWIPAAPPAMFAPRSPRSSDLHPVACAYPWATRWPGRMGRTTSDLSLSYLRRPVDGSPPAPRLWPDAATTGFRRAGRELAAVLASSPRPRTTTRRRADPGEAGGGKTRLLDEVVSQPAGAHSRLPRGAGVGFLGGRIPYAPLVAALRSLLARLPRADVPRGCWGTTRATSACCCRRSSASAGKARPTRPG